MIQEQSKAKRPTVSEMVRADYRVADVFKKWGINYCCGGNLPMADVCELKGLDQEKLEAELLQATKAISIPGAIRFDNWPVPFLVDYISYVHHAYIKAALPQLTQTITLFVSGHQKKYPYLGDVQQTFLDLGGELMEHVRQEEESIFPYIKQVSNTYERKEDYSSLFVRTLRKSLVDSVQSEQGRITALLLLLRQQTNNYTFSPEACTNHQVIYHKLKEFDADLVQHKHLENNILFPKVLQMEKELLHQL